MGTKLSKTLLILLILSAFGIGVFLYPSFPATIVGHWDANGQPNGTISKFWGLFLVPFIQLFFFVLYLVIPRIDPLKTNIDAFKNKYNLLWVVLSLFIFYVHVLTLFWNSGHVFSFITFLLPAFGVLWFTVGTVLKHTRPNWFVGIRTPWTLSSPMVWERTHLFGGNLFQIASLCSLIGIFFPHYGFLFVLIPILATALSTVIYSYIIRER
jgi:uncharacterized membrane protein